MTEQRIADIEKAAQLLSNAVAIMGRERKVLDQVWYSKEILDHVLNGDSYEEALEKFCAD